MRRILILIVLAGWTISGVAYADQMVTIPASAYKAILERLDALQKRVDQLEGQSMRKKARGINDQQQSAIIPKVEQLEKDVESIYDTLDEVETKTLKDRINWGAELRTRVDYFRLRDHLDSVTGREVDWSNDNHWTTRFRLNMDTKITRGLLFHGRLTVFKNWADSDRPDNWSDMNSAHVPGDTSVKLDRAYVDWVVPGTPIPLAVTFGRHPSTEGPPTEFKENRLRQSTYPALLFDGEADGIVMTFGLEGLTGLRNSALRFAYGKGYQSDDDRELYLDSRGGLNDLNVMAAFFETEIPRLRNSLLVLSYIHGEDFVDSPVDTSANLGDMDIFGVHAQAANFLDSGFDIFFSWGVNYSDPNRTVVNMPVGSSTVPMGLLSSDGRSSRTGWSIFTGFRYTLPFSRLNKAKIGFEFNHGSKYWYSFTPGSAELYNKLASRGNVYDFYYIQPINRYLFLRTGYTLIDYDYSLSGWHIGQPQKIDDRLSDFYFLIDCRF